MTTKTSFEIFAQLEPRLLDLRASARAFKLESDGKDSVCANRFWYTTLKPQLVKLVGFERPVDGEPVPEPLPNRPISLSELLDHGTAETVERHRLIDELPGDMQTLYWPIAYDVCCDAIYDELPDCKNCACW